MPRALKVTEENTQYIIDYGMERQFNLQYITYSMDEEIALDSGEELYVITDGTVELDNVTFMTLISSDFFRNWKFKSAENPSEFVEIERV